MSYYVKRVAPADSDAAGHVGWVGPITSYRQALREHGAWTEAGWEATLHESSPELRREVNAWQRDADVRHGRR